MARTILNQGTQVGASLTYSTVATPGIAYQTGALTLNDDLTAIRNQIRLLLDVQQTGNWFDDISVTPDGKKRSIKQLNTGLDVIETKNFSVSTSMYTAIPVPAGQNYVLLSVASNQAPTSTAAIGPTTPGAVVAQSTTSGAPFLANELTAIPGNDPSRPINKILVVDATTRNVVETSDQDIFGLLQVESTAADGASFSDTSATSRVKISFVYYDVPSNTIKPVPVADIGGKSVRYTYATNTPFSGLPRDALGNGGYIDSVAAVDINLGRSVLNQGNSPVNIPTDLLWRQAANTNWKIQNAAGTKDLLSISPGASGNAGAIATDTFAFSTTSAITSVKGASLATASQAINVGVTNGQIDSTGPFAIKSLGSNALNLAGGSSLTFTDGFEAASTWVSGPIPLATNSGDWTAYKAQYGEVSLLSSILKAGQMGSHGIYTAYVTAASIAAGQTVTGAGASANLSVAFPDSSKVTASSSLKVHVNGILLTKTDDFALVAGSTTTDLTFTFPLRGGTQPDKITIEIFGNPSEIGG